MRRRFDFLSTVQKLQKRVGVIIRFTITVSVACSTATFSNWFQYKSYWNNTELVKSETRESQARERVNHLNSSLITLNEELENNIQRVRILEQQSLQIDSLNAFFLSLEPDGREFALVDLRKELGFEHLVKLGNATSVSYSNRYLNSRGARVLAEILEVNWITPSSNIKIKVLEKRNHQPATIRREELKRAFRKLENLGVALNIEVQSSRCQDYFDHARLLEVKSEGSKRYKFLFDQGMDFLEFERSTRKYRIKVPTYVTVTSTQN
ncbi:hypothetical protein [Scytonema sp. NUACC26]|uniref:hypothetical protein n=1 Tax=Scytonema sp. NUACC26 TaxID=3140176 RepID=UPI0034DC6DC2